MAKENGKLYPLEVISVDPATTAELNKNRAWPLEFILIGPNRYFMPKRFEAEAAKIYNMEVRPTDTWLLSTQRSGTTLMQEMIWQLSHDFNFEKSKLTPLRARFSSLLPPNFIEYMVKERPEFEGRYRGMASSAVDKLVTQPITAPRFIKTHLALSLLPPGLLDTAKVVYIARNPFDVVVSYYHFIKSLRFVSYKGDFPTLCQNYINGRVNFLPYFSHVKEAWVKKDHPNVLFLFYEEVVQDMPKTIRRVASFLGKEITDKQVSMLTEHLKIENCKKNPALNNENLMECGLMERDMESFIRKGKSGGWRSYFDVDMTRQAEQWITENLQDTDLRFPTLDAVP